MRFGLEGYTLIELLKVIVGLTFMISIIGNLIGSWP
jgi:hypothetical protein